MNFHTQIEIQHSRQELSYNDSFLLLGSCFSDSIAQKLTAHAFRVTGNPFGTLYNPLSIAKMINSLSPATSVSETHLKGVSTRETEGFFYDGLWHSFLHHGRFSHADRETFERNIAESICMGRKALQEATTIIVTFGTAWVYEREGEIVSNCHKLPEREFTRRRLSVEEIVATWQPIVERFTAAGKRVIFTVSPIRHKRDGFHENQLSKAVLLLAIEQLGEYFPAYEIVLDELRDYRFFAEDMVHPSPVAVDYIWERFADTFFSSSTRETMRLRLKEYKHSQHRALH